MTTFYHHQTFVHQRVTYKIEVDGKLITVENVPAHVCVETGERLFTFETVERIHKLVSSRLGAKRIIIDNNRVDTMTENNSNDFDDILIILGWVLVGVLGVGLVLGLGYGAYLLIQWVINAIISFWTWFVDKVLPYVICIGFIGIVVWLVSLEQSKKVTYRLPGVSYTTTKGDVEKKDGWLSFQQDGKKIKINENDINAIEEE